MTPRWSRELAPDALVVCGKAVTSLRLAPDGRFWVSRHEGSTMILSRDELSLLGWSDFPDFRSGLDRRHEGRIG